MPEKRIRHAAFRARAALLSGLALLPAPALAQYIGNAPPPPLPPALAAGQSETPAAALARAVRTLAQSPRDFGALIAEGPPEEEVGLAPYGDPEGDPDEGRVFLPTPHLGGFP